MTVLLYPLDSSSVHHDGNRIFDKFNLTTKNQTIMNKKTTKPKSNIEKRNVPKQQDFNFQSYSNNCHKVGKHGALQVVLNALWSQDKDMLEKMIKPSSQIIIEINIKN